MDYTFDGTSFTQYGYKLLDNTGNVGNAEQGYAVSLSADGKTAVVGGPLDNSNVGAVWIYTFNGSVFAQVGSKLVGNDYMGTQAAQGSSVSISANGKTAVAGGPGDGSTGAIWVYTFNGTGFEQAESKLVGIGNIGNAQQGISVSISSDAKTILAGGSRDNADSDTGDAVGAAWIFTFNGANYVQAGNKLVGAGQVSKAEFGSAVSLSGDGKTALIGGLGDDADAGGSRGAGWIFTFDGANYTQAGNKLVGTGGLYAAQGSSVSISADGNTAVIGGQNDDNYKGAIWIYTFNGVNYVQAGSKLVGTGSANNAQQGTSVSISADGSTIIEGGTNGHNNTNLILSWVFINPNITCTGPSITGISIKGSTCINTSISVVADATGSGLLSYDWYDNGLLVESSYSYRYDLLTLSNTSTGNYYCVVSNACGAATSSGINVAINQIQPLQVVHCLRLFVQAIQLLSRDQAPILIVYLTEILTILDLYPPFQESIL